MTTTHPHSRSPGDALTPHARGLHPWPARRHQVHGIIPAHAGFTPSTTGAATGWSDHPRTRGVYSLAAADLLTKMGSSPHARGLPVGAHRACGGRRIIPACAGFTAFWRAGGPRRADHPRMRGVYRVNGLDDEVDGRIIPACAGFTLSLVGGEPDSGDHPRMRGVYPHHLVTQRRSARIIPARAGFTAWSTSTSTARADHPRACGVYA